MPYPSSQDCCYLGTGVVRLAPWNAWQQGWAYPTPCFFNSTTGLVETAPAFIDIGEANRLDIEIRSKTQTLPRYDGCGGEQCATETLEGVSLSLGLDCLNWSNLSLALRGALSEINTEIPNQQSWGFDWGANWGTNFNPINPLTGQPLPLPQGAPIAQNAALKACFSQPVALLFQGRNAITGTGLTVFVPKVKLALAKTRPIISDDIAQLSLSGTVLYCDNSSGNTGATSNYFDEIYTT